jgi:hypothetical protein
MPEHHYGGFWRCICGAAVPFSSSHLCILSSPTAPWSPPINALPSAQSVVESLQTALAEATARANEAEVDRDRLLLRYSREEGEDGEPFDLDDEANRLQLAKLALTNGNLLAAAEFIYGTQGRIAQEYLRRKHATEPEIAETPADTLEVGE